MNPLTRAKEFFTSKNVPLWKKVAAVIAILYVLDPIDLIPDTIPIIGWLDDIGVIGALLGMVFGTSLQPKEAASDGSATPSTPADGAKPTEFEVLKDK